MLQPNRNPNYGFSCCVQYKILQNYLPLYTVLYLDLYKTCEMLFWTGVSISFFHLFLFLSNITKNGNITDMLGYTVIFQNY